MSQVKSTQDHSFGANTKLDFGRLNYSQSHCTWVIALVVKGGKRIQGKIMGKKEEDVNFQN